MKKFIWYIIAVSVIAITGSIQSCEEPKTICPEAISEIDISIYEASQLGYPITPYLNVEDSINVESDCISQKATAMIICGQIFLAQMDSVHLMKKDSVGGIRP